jgi:hypothetical protein
LIGVEEFSTPVMSQWGLSLLYSSSGNIKLDRKYNLNISDKKEN